jgi:hypothetical protein
MESSPIVVIHRFLKITHPCTTERELLGCARPRQAMSRRRPMRSRERRHRAAAAAPRQLRPISLRRHRATRGPVGSHFCRQYGSTGRRACPVRLRVPGSRRDSCENPLPPSRQGGPVTLSRQSRVFRVRAADDRIPIAPAAQRSSSARPGRAVVATAASRLGQATAAREVCGWRRRRSAFPRSPAQRRRR